jgi:hypothetical protein
VGKNLAIRGSGESTAAKKRKVPYLISVTLCIWRSVGVFSCTEKRRLAIRHAVIETIPIDAVRISALHYPEPTGEPRTEQ